MKRILLKRISASPDITYGVFIDGDSGLPICVSLELPWKGNQTSISCIPNGTYYAKPYSSDKFSDCIAVIDVPGRSDILIHVGNYLTDTYGCILPGASFGEISGELAVLSSKQSLKLLQKVVENKAFLLELTS